MLELLGSACTDWLLENEDSVLEIHNSEGAERFEKTEQLVEGLLGALELGDTGQLIAVSERFVQRLELMSMHATSNHPRLLSEEAAAVAKGTKPAGACSADHTTAMATLTQSSTVTLSPEPTESRRRSLDRGLSSPAQEAFKARLREVFDHVDTDTSGFLTRDELADGLEDGAPHQKLMHGLFPRGAPSKVQALRMFDIDRGGNVSFDEFCEAFFRQQSSAADLGPVSPASNHALPVRNGDVRLGRVCEDSARVSIGLMAESSANSIQLQADKLCEFRESDEFLF